MNRIIRSMFRSKKRAVGIVVLWLLIVGVLTQLAPPLESVEDNASANLPPAASDSMRARELIREASPTSGALPAIVVVHGQDDTPQAEVLSAVSRITEALAGPDRPSQVSAEGIVSTVTVPQAADQLVSSDGSTQLIIVPVTGNPSDESFRTAVDDVRRLAADQAGQTKVAVTGPAGIATDTVKVFSSGDMTLLLATVLLVLVLLLLIYRSPLMALVPLLAAGIAMRVAETLGAMLADAGLITISSQTASIMTVLLFGVGTDYALIITARYREALREESDRPRAMQTALREVGETIVASASTVVLAMMALLVAVSPSLRGFGPYLALGVAVMALVAFTFIPALILIFGRAVFWPSSERKAAERSQGGAIWQRVASLVHQAPAKVAAALLILLAVMSAGLFNYQETFNSLSGFRTDTESAQGQALIADQFGPGRLAPATVVVRTDGDLRSDPATKEIESALTNEAGVDHLAGPPTFSEDGRTAFFDVVLDKDPYSAAALDAVKPLENTTRNAAADAGISDAEVLVGGETASMADIRDALNRDTIYIVLLILLVVTAVLILLLRSLLAPLYLVATLVLSFLATMGVTVFFTVTVLGDEGIGNRVTAYVFIFLVALGVDYNIFIMSRFRREVRSAMPSMALRTALLRTGGVVSSAGLILAATFSVLMTQPIRELFQFGVAMAFGILLDTFLIRPLLVPAIVRLLGDRALWPTQLPHPETATAAGSPFATASTSTSTATSKESS